MGLGPRIERQARLLGLREVDRRYGRNGTNNCYGMGGWRRKRRKKPAEVQLLIESVEPRLLFMNDGSVWPNEHRNTGVRVENMPINEAGASILCLLQTGKRRKSLSAVGGRKSHRVEEAR